MTILFLDQYGALGGAQRCLLDLAPHIRALGWTFHAAAPADGPLLEKLIAAGAASATPIRCGPYSSGRKSATDVVRFAWQAPWLARALVRLAERSRADLLYVNGPRLLPSAALTGRPVLFHCHNRLRGSQARLAARSLAFARATVIASSRFAAAPFARFQVIYNGVAGPQAPRRAHDGLRIGVIGRVEPQKGQAIFIEAARRLVRDFPDCRFVICGAPLFGRPDYLDEMRDAAAGLPVEFTGWQDDVYSVLGALDLLVVPSVEPESTPRVILEAYAAGVPVVAFASGGIPEIVEDGRTGFLIDSPTPDALARRIREILPARELLDRVAQNACERWRARFTLDRYQREIAEAIRRAAGETGRKRAPR